MEENNKPAKSNKIVLIFVAAVILAVIVYAVVQNQNGDKLSNLPLTASNLAGIWSGEMKDNYRFELLFEDDGDFYLSEYKSGSEYPSLDHLITDAQCVIGEGKLQFSYKYDLEEYTETYTAILTRNTLELRQTGDTPLRLTGTYQRKIEDSTSADSQSESKSTSAGTENSTTSKETSQPTTSSVTTTLKTTTVPQTVQQAVTSLTGKQLAGTVWSGDYYSINFATEDTLEVYYDDYYGKRYSTEYSYKITDNTFELHDIYSGDESVGKIFFELDEPLNPDGSYSSAGNDVMTIYFYSESGTYDTYADMNGEYRGAFGYG